MVIIDKQRIFTDKTTAMDIQIDASLVIGGQKILISHDLHPDLLQDEAAMIDLTAALIARANYKGPEQKLGRKVNLSTAPDYIKEQIKRRLIEKGYPVRPDVDCSTWAGVTAGEYNNSKFVHTTSKLYILRTTCAGKAKMWDWATFYAML